MMVKSSMMASPMESGARAEVKRGCTETAKAMEKDVTLSHAITGNNSVKELAIRRKDKKIRRSLIGPVKEMEDGT